MLTPHWLIFIIFYKYGQYITVIIFIFDHFVKGLILKVKNKIKSELD